ncbi:acyl-CoA synthetase (AMP-forming)/AMP-acid ligase II [Bradyrhizobium sp. GM2.4]
MIDFVPGPQDDLGGCALVGPAVGPASSSGASRGDDDAFILLTSGTAARPKMVPLTHRNVCLSAYNAGRVLSLASHDRLLNVLPLFHAHGLISGLLTALAAGSSVVCTEGFDAASFFGWMRQLRPTWYTAVPTIHRALLTAAEANPDLARSSSLRVIRSASASLTPAILDGLEATFGVPVLETYGMTEAASQIAANPFELRKVGSVGRAAGPEITIMDETGRALASGQHGEIMLRGPNMSRGYYNDEAATQAAFRDGWFRTGDLGYLDADGYLFIVGRIKDVINRGGQKISPLEVEEVLLSHPAVLEAGVFAVPHPKLGENVAAIVVLRPNSEGDFGPVAPVRPETARGLQGAEPDPQRRDAAERRQRQGQAQCARRIDCNGRRRGGGPSAAQRAGDRARRDLGQSAGAAAGRGRSGRLCARCRLARGDADAFAPARTLQCRFLVRGRF